MDVLVVDGDGRFGEYVAELLREAGHSVMRVEDGETAIVAALESRPALALLDINLPGVSGYEVCRRLRAAFGDDIGVIFVTGDRLEPYDRVGGLLLGADDYLVKPVEPDELLARARTLLRRIGSAHALSGENRPGDAQLTAREREVLGLLARGCAQQAIAERLVISPKTVATHIQRILAKLGVHSRAEAVAFAHRWQLVEA